MTDPVLASTLADLRTALATVEREFLHVGDERHVERLALTTAIVTEALRRVDYRAVLVGGGAIEFYAPDAYLTRDVDLVVEGPPGVSVRGRISEVFDALGFVKLSGRHWERGGLLIEVPGHRIDDPYREIPIGPYHLNVIRLEVVLAGRIVEFEQTGHTGHAAQAVLLLRALRDTLDMPLLETILRRERAEQAFVVLDDLATSSDAVTDSVLRDLHEKLHSRGRYAPGYLHEAGDPQEPIS
ncbi:MAG TPA: hypothetical protein VNU46_08390 [Gemmatimonadaceae bacterium]|nr:hypothetical protein [Gemmatimonadaceae bacterium]